MIRKIKQQIQMFLKRREQHKYNVVRQAWVEFYTIRWQQLKPVEFLPPIMADQQMRYIMAAGELNAYYKRVMRTNRKVAA